MRLGNSWDEQIGEEFNKDYYLKLREFLKHEYSSGVVCPDMYDLYNAFRLTAYDKVKVVILGQDPYHTPGQAHGLCFSVKSGILPPSLQNIYKELRDDVGAPMSKSGELTKWAEQGVFLLNTVLSVRRSVPLSHKDMGWETFTDAVIKSLSNRAKPVVFMLWGKIAAIKRELIAPWHFILEAPHPSPFSAHNGFFGCKHFSKANELLQSIGEMPIDWSLV